MALKNTLDPAAAGAQLAAWLPAALGDGVEEAEVVDLDVPHGTGLSAQTLLFEAHWRTGGRAHSARLAARILPAGPAAQFYPDYDLEREATVLRALSATGLPVPKVRWVEPDPAVLGGPFLVSERIDGLVAADDPPHTMDGWVTDLAPEQQGALFDNALAALVAVHGVDWQAAGLENVLTGPRGLDRELAWLEGFYDLVAPDRGIPVIDASLRWIHANRPEEEGETTLQWGDARLGNIMFDEGLSVAAVLDFEGAALGAREIDLGWWLFIQRMFTDGMGAPAPPGFPSRQAQLARYEELSGVRLGDMDYYETLGGLKEAIMLARAAQMMIAGGSLPADSEMAVNNPATQLLAGMLGLPAPSGASTDYVGNR